MPSFGSATVSNKSYTKDAAITAFTLPAATSGDTALTYTVTGLLPAGRCHPAPAPSSRRTSCCPKPHGALG